MNTLFRLIGLTILVILLLGGLVASVFAYPIEVALTVSSHGRASPTVFPTTSVANTAITAVATPVATNILSQDTFQRVDQLSWGAASDGHLWGGDATNKKVFSVAGKTGQIANGRGAFDAILGPIVNDADVQFRSSISQFNQTNLGAVLRWKDTNNWYKAYIDGTQLVVLKRVASISTRLGASPFKAKAGVVYTLRFQAIGTHLLAKVWQAGNTEPPDWMLTITDTTFQGGYGGLRVLLGNGIVATITSFRETTVTANP